MFAQGIAFALLSFGLSANPESLPSEVQILNKRQLIIPVKYDDKQRDKIKQVRLLISENRGKTWKYVRDFDENNEIIFEVSEDGLYWFAMQIVYKDGKVVPAELKDIHGTRKVFVNTSGKTITVQKSYLELQEENTELRKKIELLEKELSKTVNTNK